MHATYTRFLNLLLGLCALGVAPAALRGQPIRPQPMPWPPAPLLYVRVMGPAGAQASFYQGALARTLPTPTAVGLRPGYIYRFKLDRLPGQPGVALFPTIEVRGTLQLPPTLSAANYPAPVLFTEQDIAAAAAGNLITKVIALENPQHALPEPAVPGQPLEIQAASDELLAEAQEYGRPLAVVRLGGRTFTDAEVAHESVPGTILLPGQRYIAAPAARPCVPCAGVPVYGAGLGVAPSEAECLKDGGDPGWHAGLDPNGQIHGLTPSDTVAAYTDSHGRHLTPSNRICICVPRFIVLRRETVLVHAETVAGLGRAQGLSIQEHLKSRVPSLTVRTREVAEGFHGREKASAAIATEILGRLLRLEILTAINMNTELVTLIGTARAERLTTIEKVRLYRQAELARELSQPYGPRAVTGVQVGPQVVGRANGVNVVGIVQETRSFTVACNEVPHPPGKPLVLYKWASATAAHVGDVLTIYLKYSNVGGQPITDVAVADSLTGRLEYVPGTAKTNRDAVFTTQVNEAGSMILHWEVRGALLPGDSGVVSFQVRVR